MADIHLHKGQGGFLRLHHGLVDALARFPLTGAERRIVDCVIRFSYGVRSQKWASLTIKKVQEYTRLSPSSIAHVLPDLCERQVLIREWTGSLYRYTLNKHTEEWCKAVHNVKPTKALCKPVHVDMQTLAVPVMQARAYTYKDTEKTMGKDSTKDTPQPPKGAERLGEVKQAYADAKPRKEGVPDSMMIERLTPGESGKLMGLIAKHGADKVLAAIDSSIGTNSIMINTEIALGDRESLWAPNGKAGGRGGSQEEPDYVMATKEDEVERG